MTAQHTHTADLESTADFLNTLAIEDGVPVEHLTAADDAIAFLAARGLSHDDALRGQAVAAGERAWLDRVRQGRAAMRELWDAEVERRTPDQAALDTLNSVLRAAPRTELVLDGGRSSVGHRHAGDDPVAEALALLAEPLVGAIAAGTTERLRICANDDCRWAFEDTSRAGRRRWCEMSSCGNVAKARRYRARHRGSETAAEGPAAASGG